MPPPTAGASGESSCRSRTPEGARRARLRGRVAEATRGRPGRSSGFGDAPAAQERRGARHEIAARLADLDRDGLHLGRRRRRRLRRARLRIAGWSGGGGFRPAGRFAAHGGWRGRRDRRHRQPAPPSWASDSPQSILCFQWKVDNSVQAADFEAGSLYRLGEAELALGHHEAAAAAYERAATLARAIRPRRAARRSGRPGEGCVGAGRRGGRDGVLSKYSVDASHTASRQ